MRRSSMAGKEWGVVALLATAGCGHAIWSSASGVSPVAVSETYACADSVAKALGYREYQVKPGEGFLRMRKGVTGEAGTIFDEAVYDQLRVEIAASGAGSRLTVTAESYVEQASRRGREETERASRPGVVADARTLAQTCGEGRKPPTDRVPNAS